jgi:hypothetical protein
MKKSLGTVAVAAAMALSLSACGGSGSSAESAKGEVSYWLWDANQLPAYQQCADDFTKANPDIKVKITQRGWDDYWSTLTNGFVGGTAPDVFTNHLGRYGELAENKQLLPIDDAVKKDNVDLAAYNEGLADLWVGQDGKRYGLPKDWDTIGLFYNKAMLTKAGISEDQMKNLTWNPQDGGTYEKVIAHLTVDKSGKRGDEAGFDKNNVAVYGLGLNGGGDSSGQTEWSYFANTTGWTHTDKNPWGTHYNYDDPQVPVLHRLVRRTGQEGLHAQARVHRRRSPWPIPSLPASQPSMPTLMDGRPVHGLQGHRGGHRPDSDGPGRQARVDVQRPGRLDLGRNQEEGCSHQVGGIPRLGTVPGRRCVQGCSLPGPQGLLRQGLCSVQGQGR